MLIAPHVFEITGDPVFNPNYEVDEVVWAPLAAMAKNEIHDYETMPMAGTPTSRKAAINPGEARGIVIRQSR